MPTVRIMLAPSNVMRDMYCSRADGAQQKLIKDNLDKYLTLPPMVVTEVHVAVDRAILEGDDYAEEMFDLTNNPDRDDERQARYGNGRSLSIGDIVKVNDKMFACLSTRWEEIS